MSASFSTGLIGGNFVIGERITFNGIGTDARTAIGITQNTSLAVVAPGIAEALFATALGLVAAIPAVIFYNKLNRKCNNKAERNKNYYTNGRQ